MTTLANPVLETVKSKFDFSVDKFPLSGPEGMKTPLYGLFRSDSGEFVGKPVSKNYVPHTSDDVLALVESASEAFDGIANVQCGFRNGHYVSITPSKQERRSIFGTQDNIFPRFIVNASYDGRSFRSVIGYYRDQCRNLAMLQQVQGTSVAIRHGSNLRSKMDELITTFSTLKQSWTTLSDVMAELENREVVMTDFLDQIYGQPDNDSARAVTVHKNRTEAIFRRLQSERFNTGRGQIQSDWKVSAYEAYNAVQGYTQHDKSRHGSPDSFSRIIQAASDPKVKQAESIVLSLIA